MPEFMSWNKERLQSIVDGAKGSNHTVVECHSEEGAKRLRFALYKFQSKKPSFRISVYGRIVTLVPLKDQIKEVKHIR